LALDQNGDGTDGRDGPDGRTGGRTGRTDGRTDGTDGRDGRTECSFTVLLGRRNTVYSTTGTEKYSVQYYWDREIQETFSPPREFPFYDRFSYQYKIEVPIKPYTSSIHVGFCVA